MTEPLVVLLYSTRFIPPDVLSFLTASVPSGFRWQPVEQSAPQAVRAQEFAAADYIFAYPGDPTRSELANAPRLKLFQLLSAGHDWLDLPLFRELGIPVASNDGANSTSTAEHALLLMLALLKQLPLHHTATMSGEWLAMQQTLHMRELRGKVVGLVGFGRIAKLLAQRLRAFEATVLYTKATRAAADEERAHQVQYRPLDQLLAESDIVSLHAPLTAATRGLIDARALLCMRRGGWLVNTARGALVDEAALVDALRTGHLSGAGLDAFAHEPLAMDSPLLQLPSVVLTPHIAGVTRDAWVHRLAQAWSNVQRVQSGMPPLSRIA